MKYLTKKDKELLAKREQEIFETCFAHSEQGYCKILKTRDCVGCKFYKTVEEVERYRIRQLEIEKERGLYARSSGK